MRAGILSIPKMASEESEKVDSPDGLMVCSAIKGFRVSLLPEFPPIPPRPPVD